LFKYGSIICRDVKYNATTASPKRTTFIYIVLR
jgi:hypothetical protein